MSSAIWLQSQPRAQRYRHDLSERANFYKISLNGLGRNTAIQDALIYAHARSSTTTVHICIGNISTVTRTFFQLVPPKVLE